MALREEIEVLGEVPFETGLVFVNELLARLQEPSWEQEARDANGRANDRIDSTFDPPELIWLRPPDCRPDDIG